jgi:hypothetical protein
MGARRLPCQQCVGPRLTGALGCCPACPSQAWYQLAATDVSGMVESALTVQTLFWEEVSASKRSERGLRLSPLLLSAYRKTKAQCVAAVDHMHHTFKRERLPAAAHSGCRNCFGRPGCAEHLA